MKKVLFLIVASLFIFSGAFAAEGVADDNVKAEKKAELSIEKAKKDFTQTKKIDRKELRKFKKEFKKKIKQRKKIHKIKDVLNNMLMVGLGILILGLLLYLITVGWLGIAVMVIGLVLLLYGVLKQYF